MNLCSCYVIFFYCIGLCDDTVDCDITNSFDCICLCDDTVDYHVTNSFDCIVSLFSEEGNSPIRQD